MEILAGKKRKKKKVSTMQMTLKLLRKEGGIPAIVEKVIPFKFIKQDAFGFVDVVSLHPSQGEILFVQCTTMANMSSHREKTFTNPNFKAMLEAGGVFEFHAWRKIKSKKLDGKLSKVGKWECSRERFDYTYLKDEKKEQARL